jgi:hypothetical protein
MTLPPPAPPTGSPACVADLRGRTNSFAFTFTFTRPDRRQALRWLAVGRNGECAIPAARPEDLFAAALGVPTGRSTR